MAANITIGSLVLASNGKTLTGTLSGGTGTGYAPASGVANFSLTVNGVARKFCASSISGTTWTGIAYTPIPAGATVTVVAITGSGAIPGTGHTYLSDSGSNTATAQSYAVTNNSTRTQADVITSLCSKPSGWDSTWSAARGSSAISLAEVVVFGDSTTYGSGPGGISWVYDLRGYSVAAGFADGGIGQAQYTGEVNAYKSPVENLDPIASGSWSGAGNTFFSLGGAVSSGSAQTVTLQGRGTRIRLYYAQFNNTGDFTYSIDGASAVTVNAYSSGLDTSVIDITGLTNDLHTVALSNIGSRAQPSPVVGNLGTGGPATTTLSNGTYQYAVTGLDGSNNETLPSYTNTATIDGAKRAPNVSITTSGRGSITKYRIYRSFNGGAYEQISEQTPFATNPINVSDTGLSTTAVNPPSVATLTRDTTASNATVVCDFVRDAGIVFHKSASSGATFNTYGLDGAAYNGYPHQVPLGLTHAKPSTTPASRPPWRIPKLSVCALGINNQQAGQSSTTLVTTGITNWSAASAGAGASRLLVIPHYSRANSSMTAKAFIDDAKAYADSNGIAWFDFNVALDLADFGNTSDPHIAQAGYDAEAKRIWDAMIGLSAVTIAGPSSGVSGNASASFTVTRNSGFTFAGADTITLSDGGNGGTFTPSAGSPGVGTVTVTPTNGATSFTFTYTPASSGTKTITPTNGQGWTNPTALSYEATAAGNARTTIHVGYQGMYGPRLTPRAVADPLAGIDFALRLQTHRPGSNTPIGLWQDIDRTIPATQDGDPICVWEDIFVGGLVLIQDDPQKQGILFFEGGVPVILMDGVDDNYVASNSLGLSQPFSIILGARSNISSGGIVDSTTSRTLIANNSGPTIVMFNGGFICPSSYTNGTWAQISANYNGLDSFSSVNGVGSITQDGGSGQMDELIVNTWSGALGEGHQNDFTSIMIGNLTEDQRATVESYVESLNP